MCEWKVNKRAAYTEQKKLIKQTSDKQQTQKCQSVTIDSFNFNVSLHPVPELQPNSGVIAVPNPRLALLHYLFSGFV